VTIDPAMAMVAYGDLRRRVTALVGELDDETAAATPVPACPGWSVVDVTGHLCGVCVDILDGNLVGVGTAPWADAQAERLAPLGLGAVVDRWNDVGPEIEALGPHFPAAGAAQLVFDATTHEHDLRGALGSDDAQDTAFLVIPLDFLRERLDGYVRTTGLPALRLAAPDGWAATAGEGDPEVQVSATTFELFRSFGGRRSLDAIRALDWTGDPEPYLGIFDDGPLVPPPS
jgi:uncharacterized protein (TIGR03083 family)